LFRSQYHNLHKHSSIKMCLWISTQPANTNSKHKASKNTKLTCSHLRNPSRTGSIYSVFKSTNSSISITYNFLWDNKSIHFSAKNTIDNTEQEQTTWNTASIWTITNSWSVYTNRSSVTSHAIQKGILMFNNNVIIKHLTLLKNRSLWRIPMQGGDFNPFLTSFNRVTLMPLHVFYYCRLMTAALEVKICSYTYKAKHFFY
jgi:hypothetical protein